MWFRGLDLRAFVFVLFSCILEATVRTLRNFGGALTATLGILHYRPGSSLLLPGLHSHSS